MTPNATHTLHLRAVQTVSPSYQWGTGVPGVQTCMLRQPYTAASLYVELHLVRSSCRDRCYAVNGNYRCILSLFWAFEAVEESRRQLCPDVQTHQQKRSQLWRNSVNFDSIFI